MRSVANNLTFMIRQDPVLRRRSLFNWGNCNIKYINYTTPDSPQIKGRVLETDVLDRTDSGLFTFLLIYSDTDAKSVLITLENYRLCF